jgi:hypothetical protein
MARGTYKLKQQIGGRGAFAWVTLEIEESKPPNNVIISDSNSIAHHFVAAAKTGIQYAQMQLLMERQNPPTVDVTILELIENPVDTREIMVVYAACMAYCDALKLTLKNPIKLDSTNRCISFPLGTLD